MAKGKLAKVMSQANGVVTAYQVSSQAQMATITVDLENTDTADANVKVYFADTNTPGAVDQVATASIPGSGGHLELSCKLLGASEYILIWSDTDKIAIRISGIESIPSTT